MQYNGVTIGEAMIDGEIVYRSVPALYLGATNYYPLSSLSLANKGTGNAPLVMESGAFADRGNHAYVNGARASFNSNTTGINGFTWSGWFQPTSSSTATQYLLNRGNASNWMAVRKIGGQVSWRFNAPSSTATSWYPVTDADSMIQGQWNHIAITMERVGSANKVVILLNGAGNWREFNGQNHMTLPLATQVVVGNYHLTTSNYPFDGNIDDIAAWDRALTPTELREVYNYGRSA